MREFIYRHIFTRTFAEHLFSFIGIVFILMLGKDFLVFFLTAFLCAYLFHEATQWSQIQIIHLTKKTPKYLSPLLLWISQEKVLLSILYLLFAFICIFIIRDIWPALTNDMLGLLQSLSQKFSIDIGIDGLRETLGQWQQLSSQVGDLINVISPESNTQTLLEKLFQIGSILFQVIFAYIISFIWLIEYEKVQKYFAQLKKWPFSFFYHDLKIIFQKINKSFGLVFQAQSKIAIVNTILTMAGLFIIGLFYGQMSLNGTYIFPYFLALWCITFFTSFVPILGVFIGGVPIVFAGVVEYPGWGIVIALVVMLFFIHTIEGYFLNPRIVGRSLNIPAPVIFLILFIAEHFIGIAGFFLGVPLYLLLTELFESIGHMIQKIQKTP